MRVARGGGGVSARHACSNLRAVCRVHSMRPASTASEWRAAGSSFASKDGHSVHSHRGTLGPSTTPVSDNAHSVVDEVGPGVHCASLSVRRTGRAACQIAIVTGAVLLPGDHVAGKNDVLGGSLADCEARDLHWNDVASAAAYQELHRPLLLHFYRCDSRSPHWFPTTGWHHAQYGRYTSHLVRTAIRPRCPAVSCRPTRLPPGTPGPR